MATIDIFNSPSVAPYLDSFDRLLEKGQQMPFLLKSILRPVTPAKTYKELAFDTRETRILVLQPGPYGSIIYCSLETVSLSKPGAYVALSYCWGPPSGSVQIFISGIRTSISVNLGAALQQLRAMGMCRIWADALSINQLDVRERGLQVRLMKEIYSKASTVVAWLGPSSAHSRLVFDAIKEMPKSSPVDAAEGHLIDHLMAHTPDTLSLALHDLCERPYWRRMWIIQEIAVASRVKILCGSEEVAWEDLIGMMARYESSKLVLAPGYQSHIKQIALLRNDYQDGNIGLLDAMARTRHAEATDPRDKIYALLGLCHDGLRLVPFPDYIQPLHEVMRDLSRAMMKAHKSLDFCFLRHAGYPSGNALPTWALDWIGLWTDPSNIFEARIPKQTGFVLDRSENDDDLLKVSGREVGTINRLCNVSLGPQHGWRLSAVDACQRYYSGPDGVTDAMQACLSLNFTQNVDNISKKHISQFLSNLWLQDGTIDPPRVEQIHHHLQNYDREVLCSPAESILGTPRSTRWLHLLHAPENSVSQAQLQAQVPLPITVITWLEAHAFFHIDRLPLRGWWDPSMAFSLSKLLKLFIPCLPWLERKSSRQKCEEELILAIARIAHNELRFFVTDEGMIGLADEKAQIGDKVCVLSGCSMPALLREVRRTEGLRYRFVGEAHVRFCVEREGEKEGEKEKKEIQSGMKSFDIE